MKIFTKKFFLLAIGMILSVGASAQGDGIKHRYPQLNYTYNGVEAFVPAWDMVMYQGGAYPGLIRLQITKVIREDLNDKPNNEYECKIVYRLGIRNDLSSFNYTTFSNQVTFNGKETDEEGNPIPVTKASGNVKYSDFIDISTYKKGTWFENTTIATYDHIDNNVFNYKGTSDYPTAAYNHTNSKYYVHGDLVIPEVYETSYGKFYITDIDMFAFRNNSADYATEDDKQKYWFRPESVTIPKTIKSIGVGAFFNNTSTTKIIINSESPITEIPPRVFMNDWGLEEITLPASLETIGGCALGGCEHLKKIIFTGEKAPELGYYTHTNGNTFDFMHTTAPTSFNDLTPAKCIMEVPLHSAKKYAEKDNLYKQFPMSSKFELKKDIVSYCSDLPFTFKQYNTSDGTWSDGDVKVYYVAPDGVNVEGRRIEFTEITDTKKIPTETENTETGYFGVLLKGTAGETYNIFYPNNILTEEVSADNCLEGVITDYKIEEINNQYLYYVLSNGKFLSVTQPGTLAANKAFIMFGPEQHVNINNNARELALYFPGETTGISNYDVQSSQNDAFYTLQGIRVKNPEKGVFIKNGKKIIIK